MGKLSVHATGRQGEGAPVPDGGEDLGTETLTVTQAVSQKSMHSDAALDLPASEHHRIPAWAPGGRGRAGSQPPTWCTKHSP